MEILNYCQAMWKLATQGQLQGIWFWAALYTLLICTYSLALQVRTRSWPSTRGKLAEARLGPFGAADRGTSEQDFSATALYTYNVDDVTYEGTRISPWVFVTNRNASSILKAQLASIQSQGDGTVRLFYNPRKPSKSFLIVASKTGIYITLVAACLPFIGFYFKFYP